MTKTVKIWETCAAAETKVEVLFDRALDTLHNLNQRLAQLQDAIRTSQPMASGSICLELYACSGKGCRGCPHARWVMYVWVPGKGTAKDLLKSINLNAIKKDPVNALKRKLPSYQKTAGLIREAKAILSKRSRLIASLRTLEYACLSAQK